MVALPLLMKLNHPSFLEPGVYSGYDTILHKHFQWRAQSLGLIRLHEIHPTRNKLQKRSRLLYHLSYVFVWNADEDDCLNAVCYNGGKCIDGINSYACDCKEGFIGEQCGKNAKNGYVLVTPFLELLRLSDKIEIRKT